MCGGASVQSPRVAAQGLRRPGGEREGAESQFVRRWRAACERTRESNVNLWLIQPEQVHGTLEADLRVVESWLEGIEKERHERLRSPSARREFLISRGLLRAALSSECDMSPANFRFERDRYDKPFLLPLAGSVTRDFSISHTRGLIGCAISRRCAVGLDIEHVSNGERHWHLAEKHLSSREAKDILSRAAVERGRWFSKYWTLKEAYLKGLGVGLSRPTDTFEFHIEGEEPQLTDGSGRAHWSFRLRYPSRDHVLAIALAE